MLETLNPIERRRQRRIKKRQREIMTAAAEVFAEKGYASTTTKEIADRADMAEGTLYNYFDGKREILLAIADETTAPMETAIQEAGSLKSRDEILAMLEKALAISEAHLPSTRTLLTEAWMDDDILQDYLATRLKRIRDQLAAYIKHHVDNGTFRPINPEIGAQMIMGMFGALVLPAIRGVFDPPTPQECHELAESMVDLLLDGIRLRQA